MVGEMNGEGTGPVIWASGFLWGPLLWPIVVRHTLGHLDKYFFRHYSSYSM